MGTQLVKAKFDEAEYGKVLARLDGWANVITGLGVQGKDKRMGATFTYTRRFKNELEELYGCDDMAVKVVDLLPEEMQREGFEITHQTGDEKLNDTMQEKYKELEGPTKFGEALSWARLYGGAGIIMGIDDGLDPAEPVNENGIRGISFLNVLNRWELHPLSTSIQRDPTQPMFGLPTAYMLNPESGGGENSTITIHASRILRFDGETLPRNLFIRNNYWGDTSLNRPLNAIRNFQTVHDSIATLIADFAQAVYKIKDLTQMITQGKDELVQKRLALVDSLRSIVNAIVIEEDEEFERKVTSLQGVADVVKLVSQRLVQATNIPHTILLGESPSGLGATGNSEKTDWFDYVARQQDIKYKPQLTQFFRYCFLSKQGPTNGKEPKEWEIVFNPLWQMDQKEEAEVYKMEAEADSTYINAGVLDPEEVANSRFGTNEGPIQIDKEIRAAREKERLEMQKQMLKNPPPVPPKDGQAPPQDPEEKGDAWLETELNETRVDEETKRKRAEHRYDIQKEDGKFILMSEDRKKVLGRFDTRDEAKARKKEIQAIKKKSESEE